MKQILFVFLIFVIVGLPAAAWLDNPAQPKDVIGDLYEAIEVAEANGQYRCCLEPACTMCYLGHWIYDIGTCYCDNAIAEGHSEDVCPECKKGLEKGVCSSINKEKTEECDL